MNLPNWFRHNLIADMPGPEFLTVFALAVAFAHIVRRVWEYFCDPTRDNTNIKLPSSPDPYEIAYLRGGPNEAVRVAALSLMQRGVLQVSESSGFLRRTLPLIQRAQMLPPTDLTPLERQLWQWSSMPRPSRELFSGGFSREQLENWCAPLKSSLQKQNLLASSAYHNSVFTGRFWCATCVLALGAYKLNDALYEGRRNIWFLILMMVATFISFCILPMPRLTARGRLYLKKLETAFHNLRAAPDQEKTGPSAPALLAAAIFGAAFLQGAAYADFHRAFPRAEATHSGGGGCGSGCGSSGGGSCGGGGCGGGCGGG